jgi:hypothetical protein
MVPIPAFWLKGIILELQKGSAEISDAFLKLSAVPVLRQG